MNGVMRGEKSIIVVAKFKVGVCGGVAAQAAINSAVIWFAAAPLLLLLVGCAILVRDMDGVLAPMELRADSVVSGAIAADVGVYEAGRRGGRIC